jgi:aminopeptidase YwaD
MRDEIFVSAQLDSVATPGANDNASGVAVLIELIRPLLALKLPVAIRFISFGAEEPGLIGSRVYLKRHLSELSRCKMVLNLDTVAEPGPMRVETADGIREFRRKWAVSFRLT